MHLYRTPLSFVMFYTVTTSRYDCVNGREILFYHNFLFSSSIFYSLVVPFLLKVGLLLLFKIQWHHWFDIWQSAYEISTHFYLLFIKNSRFSLNLSNLSSFTLLLEVNFRPLSILSIKLLIYLWKISIIFLFLNKFQIFIKINFHF